MHDLKKKTHEITSSLLATRLLMASLYDHTFPVSDRLVSLLETPLGAMALLSGLTRGRDGLLLSMLVRS
jgi:hypothetical protein